MNHRIIARFTTRTFIEPEQVTIQPFEEFHRVSSKTYDFVIAKKPPAELIYTHECSTPSGVLKKLGMHVLPESVPELNRREKWQAVSRQVESSYDNAYRNCSSPLAVFHLQRKIRTDIRNRLWFIGCLDGRKHKHLLKFTPFAEILAQNTQKQYEKQGVAVQALNGEKIFPSGKVWMPTNQRYLQHYIQIIASLVAKTEISLLDIGCGSGILSFLFAKQFKKGKVVALDKNADAVRTCNLNAARFQLRNIEAFECDVLKRGQFQRRTLEHKLPQKYDMIVINPPWVMTSKIQGESSLVDGVYDDGQMLKHSLSLASKVLSAEGRIIVIYSDLSHLLGLQKKSIEELCQQDNLLIEQRYYQPLAQQMVKKSALGELKSKAKILTYVLRKS